MLLDRKKPPIFQEIDSINVIQADEIVLKNELVLGCINAGTEKVLTLEIIFNTGVITAPSAVVAHAAAYLLDKGTALLSANEIATKFDSLGAFIGTEVGYEKTTLAVYSLSTNIREVIQLLLEVLTNVKFNSQELKTYINNEKQKMKVNLERVSYVAKKRFPELIFGENHLYAATTELDDFDKLTLEDIQDYYFTQFLTKSLRIQVAGDVNEGVLNLLISSFGQLKLMDSIEVIFAASDYPKPQKRRIEKKNAVQCAIRIGKPLFNRSHPDYVKMQLVSTILGGYFGSRLMANIREDKGYTYGIGSAVVPLRNAGYFFLTTEVGVEVCDAALKEIYFEINRLQTEEVTDQELKLVKNYVLGSFLKSVDGPFAQMEKYQLVKDSNLSYAYFDYYISTVKSITKEDVKLLANKYLAVDSLSELIVG